MNTKTPAQNPSLIPVILCGGAGSRLWPLSREMRPKPFIRLGDGQSLLQKAFLRGAAQAGAGEALIVTNRELLFQCQDDIAEVSAKAAPTYLLEPFGRNTAAAIAAAAWHLSAQGRGAVPMLVLAADHLISKSAAFAEAVARAQQLAMQGKLVTFGITPSAPETGFGYIETEGERALRFAEKPSAERAREYLASGRFLWNSGMFCFTPQAVLSALQSTAPKIAEATKLCLQHSAAHSVASGSGKQILLSAEHFAQVPEDSIDYAVMEKAAANGDVAVVACDIGWSDIGSWSAWGEVTAADAEGNVVEGETLLRDVQGCQVLNRAHGRIIGAVGLRNLIIVDTPDALLVAEKSRAQEVKQIFTQLQQSGHEAHKLHRTVARPWGSYTVLEEGKGFKIKRIEVKPGAALSLQRHKHRSEHWVVVEGSAQVTNGEQEIRLEPQQSTFITAGQKHRLSNPGTQPLAIIEVQCGDYLGEDDIERIDDPYQRQKLDTPAR